MGILSEAKAIYQEYRRQSQAKKTAQKQAKQQAAQPQQPQQTGSGGSNFGTKILVKLYTQHKSKFKWILLVLAIVLAGIIYQFGWESVKSFIWRHILRILAISLFFIALAYAFIKDEDKRTASIVAIPYIIWFIDSSTYFGPQYQGFKFEFFILTETNWIAVVTSSLISAMLIFNIFNEFFKKDMGFIVSMFFFAGVSYASGKLLPNLSTTTIYSILPIILAAFGIILFYVFRRQGFTLHPESLSYLFMILVFSFFWVNWKWTASTKAILHVGYILMFCLGYLGIVMGVDKTKLYAFTSLALVADFFVYNIFVAENFNPPIIVIITSILAWNLAKSYFASWNMFSIIALFTLIWFVATPLSAQGLGVDIQAKEADSAASPFKAVTQPISDFFKKVDDVVKKRSSKVAKTVEERLDIATGGYTSIVEKNQYESLGVYFSDPRAGEPVFYADEPVVVWATIQSKTYQDPVVVKFSCYRKEQDKPRINGEANPAEPFLAFQLEENDVECRFSSKSNTISSLGAVPITLSAEYNFATNAYLKAYFIDKDTYRALTRENIDPRQQFGIQDLTPQTVVTNGPMDIVINAGPIIAVADIYKPEPTIVVSVRNRQEIEDKDNKIITQWEGKIKELKELIILAPPDVEILTSTCNHPFEKYDEKKCITSCDEFVLKKCNEACSANDQNCQKECTVLNDKCKSECNDLFRVDQGQGPQDKRYNAYYLTDIKTDRASYTDIGADRHRTFFCRINPLRGVLDKTPITTRYFRVRARYDYFLENTVEVNIEPYIGSLGSVGELIDNYAVPLGMEKSLVLALMVVESSMRHCKNGGRECSPDQVIASRDSSGNPISVGVMQINVAERGISSGGHPEWKTDASAICGNKPDGSPYTVYDFDCNIKLGITILKEKYDWRGKPDSRGNPIVHTYKCPGHETKLYSGWQAAIRGYNGWGCPPKGDYDFVEKVMRANQTIGNDLIELAIKERIEKLGLDRESQPILLPKSPYIVEPVADVNAFDTPDKSNSITITWSPSPTANEYPNIRYRIERRYKVNNSIDFVVDNLAGTSYEDTTRVQDNIEYYYSVFAHTENEDSAEALSNPITSTLGPISTPP